MKIVIDIVKFLRKDYDCINLNGVTVEKNCLVIQACAECCSPIDFIAYKNRLIALISAINYARNNKTFKMGVCNECLKDEDLLKKIWED